MENRRSKSPCLTAEGMFGPSVLQWIDRHPGSVLLESNLRDHANNTGFLFSSPAEILQADTIAEVLPALNKIQAALERGWYAAGFLSYEAGYAFESSLPPVRLPETPLLWFGLYKKPVTVDQAGGRVRSGTLKLAPRGSSREALPIRTNESHLSPGLSGEQHAAALERILGYIEAGDTYQVNFTFPLAFTLHKKDTPAVRYDAFRRSQRVPYSAFINTGDLAILSVSPELFFRKKGPRLTLKPMKGTVSRGRTLEEDEEQRTRLKGSEKDRAENLMIVDLLRNDAGRIAVPGTVKVRRLFDIEKYETLFQATSTIGATLRPEVGVPDLVRALFPSGSVTGAPKIRTMQIIHELETVPRGVYTGSIGYFSPKGDAVFSVAIRTAVLHRQDHRAVVGVGSGVVHDSDVKSEYDECLLKARFLAESPEDFQLIETLLWRPGRGWSLLPLHMKRLRNSAKYFGFRCQSDVIIRRLKELSRPAASGRLLRARLLLSRDGSIHLRKQTLGPVPKELLAGMAVSRTDSRDKFLFHKTTRRKVYEQEYQSASAAGWFDMIFQNERGEITEGTRSNVIIRIGSRYFTPPVSSGLLPGTFRAHLLRSKRLAVTEKILYPDDLVSADQVLLCNAVRGLVHVQIPELSSS